MSMAGKKGNKNAEKWTKEVVLNKLDELLTYSIDNNSFYLGVVLNANGLFLDVWQYWVNKFRKDEMVLRTIKKIESVIEANLVTILVTSRNSTGAIFVLKNKYKWSDKQEIDHTSKGESIVWNENKTYNDEGKKS